MVYQGPSSIMSEDYGKVILFRPTYFCLWLMVYQNFCSKVTGQEQYKDLKYAAMHWLSPICCLLMTAFFSSEPMKSSPEL